MPRPCESCRHPRADEINRRIKQGRTMEDISLWLESLADDKSLYLSTAALGRHRRHVEPDVDPKRGQKPYSGDFLELVRDKAAEAVAAGEAKVSVQHGLQAQAQLDGRLARNADRDIIARIAMALTGQLTASGEVVEGEYVELRTDGTEEIEQEFQKLLSSGD
jgi:hypothetical protein